MLTEQLKAWYTEFRELVPGCPDVPDALWKFLDSRLKDSGAVPDDPDVVLARFGSDYRRVRIVGHQGEWLRYEQTDRIGLGMLRIKDVHPDDNRRLAEILDRLEAAR